MRVSQLVLGLTILLGFAVFAASAQDNIAIKLHDNFLRSIIATGKFNPPTVSRALAIHATAMYDAWTAFDPVVRFLIHFQTLIIPL
jgi:hypothetical protein